MIRNYNTGQEAIEFILITVLVFFASLGVILAFGNKIAAFFHSDSSVAKVANNTIAVVNPNAPVQYTPDYETKASNDNNKQLYDDYQTQLTEETTTAADTKTIAGLEVDFNADGSASFTVGSQQVDLPAELLALQDVVMETSGSSGATDLVQEIAYMIQKHEAEYPGTQVPLEIYFGDGTRSFVGISPSVSSYKGNAEANSTTIKVGNDIVMIQNDQAYVGVGGTLAGVYRVEGTIGNNNSFSGTFTGYGTGPYADGYNYSGTLNGSANLSNGLVVTGHLDKYIRNGVNSGSDCNWTFDFNESGKAFSL